MTDYMNLQRDLSHDLIRNNANRVPICICIDESESMWIENRKTHVENGIRNFIEDGKNDIYAADSIDLCLITFGGTDARIIQPFVSIRDAKFTGLHPDGSTPLGKAVELALAQIHSRMKEYSNFGIQSYHPWLIIMSDGESTDDVQESSGKTKKLVQEHRIKVKCVDMSNGKEKNDLTRFTDNKEVSTINALDIENFFSELSRSAAGVSTHVPGDDLVDGI